MSEFIKVKAVEHDGDWFIVPNDIYDEWQRLTNILSNEEHEDWMEACDDFELYFGHMRTGGDLNNIQLYRK